MMHSRIEGKNFKEFTEEDKTRRRRDNVWYHRWSLLARALKKHNSPEEIVKQVYEIIDEASGHRSRFIAYSSRQDMKLVFEDCLRINCDECRHRFECFTEE